MVKKLSFLVVLMLALGNLSKAQEYAVIYPTTECEWSCNDVENNIAATATEHHTDGIIHFKFGKQDGDCNVINTQFVCPGTAQLFDLAGNMIGLPVPYTQNDVYGHIDMPYEALGITMRETKAFYIQTTSDVSSECANGGEIYKTGYVFVKRVGENHYTKPDIITPNDGDEVPLGLLIEWKDQEVEDYTLQIAQEHYGQEPILHNECGFYDPDDIVCEKVIEGTDFVWTEGEPGKTYWLSVAIRKGTYGQSLFADPIAFTIENDASTNLPTTITPLNDNVFAKKSDLDEYIYSWTSGNCNPNHYSIIVERKDGNSDWKEILDEGRISGTEITVKKKDYKNGGIKGNGSYRWRIIGRSLSGGVMCYSEYFHFCVKICGDFATAETIGYFMDAGAHYHVPYTLGLAIAKVETDFNTKPVDIGEIAPGICDPYTSFGIMGVYPGAVQNADMDIWTGLNELAKMLKNGTYSGFEGWDEYKSMSNTEIINLIANNNISDQEVAKRANIRAGMLLLRYYAHFIQADDMFYNPTTGIESNSEYPQMGLETWWFIINRYNVKNGTVMVDDIKDLMESNYAFRVYNAIMNGVNNITGSIPITVPPHVNFRLAEDDELDIPWIQRGIAKQSDWSLIPTAPNEEDYVFVRITVPFKPRTHLGIIHDDEGNNIGMSPETYDYNYNRLILQFPIEGQSAYSARMTATFDFSDAKAGDGHRDGVVLGCTGEYGTVENTCGSHHSVTNSTGLSATLNTNYAFGNCISYDGHTAGDYNSGMGELQYPTAPGILYALPGPENVLRNVHGIIHNGFGEGYESVFSHWSIANSEILGNVEPEGMGTYIGKTGAAGTSSSHMHIGVKLRGNIGNYVLNEGKGVYVSPYGWIADNNTEHFSLENKKKALWTRARYNILWSQYPRLLLDSEEKIRAYPNPAGEGIIYVGANPEMVINRIKVSSMDGVVLIEEMVFSYPASVDVSSLNVGMYLLKAIFEDNTNASTIIFIQN